MATVIAFPISKRPARTRGEATGVGAEILFFTGVRYERKPDVETTRKAQSRPARPARKRRRRALSA